LRSTTNNLALPRAVTVTCRNRNLSCAILLFLCRCFYRAAWNADENSVRRLSVKHVHCDKTEERSVQKDHLA